MKVYKALKTDKTLGILNRVLMAFIRQINEILFETINENP